MRRRRSRSGPRERKEHFAAMVRVTMEEPAWRALSPVAQAIYPWLKLEWHGAEFNNNGDISLSVRQAAARVGVGKDTAARGFHDLQAKGFAVVTTPARLGINGEANGSAYELTEMPVPPNKGEGRKLYRQWRPGADFPVVKVMANNPRGRNRKAKPCHLIEDDPVIEMRTNGKGASR